ncbi:MAG: hypothetical protein KDC35_12225 [Acidobacteria bacterium]|nr:hypothetical protein [Acidobacteriota bacterium]
MTELHTKPTQGQLQRHVLKEAILHPTTTFPAAASLVAGLYMFIISFDRPSFATFLAAAIVTASSFVYHYFFRYDDLAGKLMEKMKRARFKDYSQLAEDLHRECARVGFREGAKESRELGQAFAKLREFLIEKANAAERANAYKFLILAEDSFKEGLSCLRSALDTHQLLKKMDVRDLKKEIVAWSADIRRLQSRPGYNEGQIDAIRTRIKSHHQRLELHKQKTELMHRQLAQSEVIEAALETTLLEVSQLLDGGELHMRTDTASKLEEAVAAARRVEQKLREVERGEGPDQDQIYADAGKKISSSE